MIKTSWSISVIARGVWGADRDPKRCWMTLFKAYYDASGSESSPDSGLVVLGLIANEDKWLRFEPAWESVLNEHQVKTHHHKDFTNTPEKSEFYSWKDDHERRKGYSIGLLSALKRGINKGYAIVIPPKVLQEINKDFEFESLYALAANVCLNHAGMWVDKKDRAADLLHFLEQGDTGQPRLRDVFRLLEAEGNKVPVSIIPKQDKHGKRVRQFEGADMVGWEIRRRIDDYYKVRRPPARELMKAIAKDLPIEKVILTAPMLLAGMRKYPHLFPPRV